MRTILKEGEEKILEVRRHWIVLLGPLSLSVIFIIFAAILFFSSFKSKDSFAFKAAIAFLVVTLGVVFYFIYRIFDRKVNIWVVTNLRIIDEYGVLSYNSKESPLDKINNISYRQSILGRILNYGNVEIQTAAEWGVITHRLVTSPKLLKNTIMKCQDDFRKGQIIEHAQKLAEAITGKQPEIGTKECPYCAEIIKAKAKICRFCGRELE